MSLLSPIERRSWKARLLDITIHALLILGSATMIYPLLLMLSGSVKSNTDFTDFRVVPQYLHSDVELYRKFLTTRYNNYISQATQNFKTPQYTVETLMPPKDTPAARKRAAGLAEFLQYERTVRPHYWHVIAMAWEYGVETNGMRDYRKWLEERPEFAGKNSAERLANMNRLCETEYVRWGDVNPPTEYLEWHRAVTDYAHPYAKFQERYKQRPNAPELLTLWPDAEGMFVEDLRERFGASLETINAHLGKNNNSWTAITLPEDSPEEYPGWAKQWEYFVRLQLNPDFVFVDSAAATPAWREFLRNKYSGIEELNSIYHTECKQFSDILTPTRLPAVGTPANADFRAFLELFEEEGGCPRTALHVETLSIDYRKWLRQKYNDDFSAWCAAEGEALADFSEVPLEAQPFGEDNLAATGDWREFVMTLPAEEVGLLPAASILYQDFLAERYHEDWVALGEAYGYEITNAAQVPAVSHFPADEKKFPSIAREDYRLALASGSFLNYLQLEHPEQQREAWQQFLQRKYGTIDQLNVAWQLVPSGFDEVPTPMAEYEWRLLQQNHRYLIREYLVRNYRMVFDTLFVNGHAAFNTLLYCCLAVLAALLVNPLCAYALSRFRIPFAGRIMMFLLLPMAFPAMVLGIPQFLMIKRLGLLNTFAALILPGMASGYSIFLLKGFFDALPRELFEAAELDGAGEWTIFWHIAMSLSKPILSVIALGAFTVAYADFMLAFLLCQKESMWTMMVYLYQLQQRSSSAVGFAALVVAAIPTLLVFIFCQKIILRGIVVPTEK